jgi:Secretion system C-terminal sorting domain/Domain of unknown function (DUF362)
MRNFYTTVKKALKKIPRLYFVIIGIISAIWFLIRVIPKPSRATYPCQKIAFPIASGFVIWLSVNLISFVGIKRLIRNYKQKGRQITLFTIIPAILFYIIWLAWYPAKTAYAASKVSIINEVFQPTDSPNTPVGTARGIFPGRVVWVHDSTAAKWNGTSGYWWNDKNTDQATVSDMVSRTLQQITGKNNDVAAWDTLFKFFNSKHGKSNIGYTVGEKIVIKLSLVQSTDPSSDGGNENFSPPQTVLALLRQLVYNAGVKAGDITFYDILRSIPKSVTDRCKSEFPGVHFVGSQTGHNQETYTRDTVVIHWSEKLDKEINGGNTAYLPTLITKASYMINLAQFKGHRYVGVTGCAKNHFGSMSADGDVNTPHAIGLHYYVTVHNFIIPGSDEWSFQKRPMGSYNALVDLMGHRYLGENTLLFMVDGLYGVPYESSPINSTCKWLQSPFNNNWTSSIFVSLDDVALESVLVDLFRYEQAIDPNITQPSFVVDSLGNTSTNVVFGNVDNILHEAAQANAPPSGTKYAPNGDGVRLPSLGVHEHWNNPTDKKYTRNLGTGNGIELDAVSPTLAAPAMLNATSDNVGPISLSWTNDGITTGSIVVYKSIGVNTNFKPIATLSGDATDYSDNTTSSGQIYYRLKRVSASEYSSFSNEAKITVTTDLNFELSNNSFNVYPNPAHNYLNISFVNPNIGNIEISITDIKGRVIKVYTILKPTYSIQQSVDLKGLQQGLYCIRVVSGYNKFVKLVAVQ